ncbi:hypothetical protein KP509_13G023100 [Ceratopteris richardii]|uniref:Uncharacterized protein n=1 Tax=Ceratopteris richardii TaxID=49495 RepID=A0A8T2TC58_CERRI|nr:hypothetical protein KP509_13G023100 [Ceratopteris richardii]
MPTYLHTLLLLTRAHQLGDVLPALFIIISLGSLHICLDGFLFLFISYPSMLKKKKVEAFSPSLILISEFSPYLKYSYMKMGFHVVLLMLARPLQKSLNYFSTNPLDVSWVEFLIGEELIN